MTSSTTPQDRAVELIRKFIVTNVGYDAGHLMTVQAQELTILLGDAGLLSSGTQEDQGDGSLRSKPPADGSTEADIELVAESLRDFRLRLGPNTIRNIRDGQDSVPLSGRERQDVARVAVEAMRSLEKP